MIARCAAGVLLGFPLAAWTIALVLHWLPQHGQPALIPMLLLFFPAWTVAIVCAFLFRNGLRAWLTLGAADALVFALLFASRHFGAP